MAMGQQARRSLGTRNSGPWMRTGPWKLNTTAPAPHMRFVPTTRAQYLASVFTIWNVLDVNIARTYGLLGGAKTKNRPSTPYGYMREVQLHAYSDLLWQHPGVRTYCEVGFNGGHGTAAMLLASPSLQVHSFELGLFPYTRTAQEDLRSYFGDRFHAHVGNSRKTIPAFAADLARTSGRTDVCDVILIDGDHRAGGVYADLLSFRPLAACNATVLIDDLNEGPGEALQRLRSEGVVEVLEQHEYTLENSPETNCVRCMHPAKEGQVPCINGFRCFPKWGWAMARYTAGCATGSGANVRVAAAPPTTASASKFASGRRGGGRRGRGAARE